MFRLLWVIFRHKFQELLHILFYSFYVLQFFSKYCNRNPFLHYKTRVNVYMVLGRGVVGSCFWCPLLFVFGGWGVSRVGKSSGCTRLRLWYALVSTSVILNHCINPSAWGHLNPSSYCDVGRLFYGVFKLWSKLQSKKWRNDF